MQLINLILIKTLHKVSRVGVIENLYRFDNIILNNKNKATTFNVNYSQLLHGFTMSTMSTWVKILLIFSTNKIFTEFSFLLQKTFLLQPTWIKNMTFFQPYSKSISIFFRLNSWFNYWWFEHIPFGLHNQQ